MLAIFKDNKRFGSHYDNAKGRLVGEADRLVDHIIECDTNVIEKLLTTEDFYVFHSGDNDAMQASSERIKKIYDYFKDLDWQNFEVTDLVAHKDFLSEVKMRGVDAERIATQGRRNSIREFKTAMTSFQLGSIKGKLGQLRSYRSQPMAFITPLPERGYNSGRPRWQGFLISLWIIGTIRGFNLRSSQIAKGCSLTPLG